MGFCRSHHIDFSSRPPSGAAFEKEVINTLRLLGYSIEQNVTINGCQIDILATFHTGVIPLRLMVECKDYDQPVGIKEVKQFAGIFASSLRRFVDKGLMVARNSFSREAKEFAQNMGIQLVSYADISTLLVDFDNYIDQVIKEYESLAVSSYYIELSGTDTENYEGAGDKVIRSPLSQLLKDYFFDSDSAKVALLGNFGTGKTTFCRKFARDLAIMYKNDPTGRIPLVINLQDYDARLDIQELITNTLQFNYGVRIDISICRELQRFGRFLIILDGFDEMATKVDEDTVRENLREIQKIASIPNNKFMLTCRTHFFKDRVQAAVLADYSVIYVPEWGESELEEYLKARCGSSWRKQLERIQGTHNLSELAQTPLFLEMIVDSFPKLGHDVRRSDLYDSYTRNWIEEQSKRRGARLSPSARLTFVSELAMILYRENKAFCHYREFIPILRKNFNIDDAAEMDYLQSDVRTCTFLIRDSAGQYSFKHKSFMEYFVAASIAEKLIKEDFEDLKCRALPLEVRRFLVDMLKESPPEKILKECIRASVESTLRDNAIALLNDLRIDLSNLQIKKDDRKDAVAKAISGFLRGEEAAFDLIWFQYRPMLQAKIRRFNISPFEAEEIIAETLFRTWKNRTQLERLDDFVPFLLKIFNNIIIDWYKMSAKSYIKIEKSYDLNSIEGEDSDPVFSKIKQGEFSNIISNSISRLSNNEASVIKQMLQNRTTGEIAKQLKMKVPTVASIRYGAMLKLRRYLAEYGYKSIADVGKGNFSEN